MTRPLFALDPCPYDCAARGVECDHECLSCGAMLPLENDHACDTCRPTMLADCDDERAKWTERDLLNRLRARHAAHSGNGPQWVFMEHVADQTGWANRRIDGLAMHLWQSRHHEVHAYEIKVSRSDFRRELADPDKSAVWTAWVEHFWIVAPAGVIQPNEVPAEWGLLVTAGGGLRVAKRAPRLHEQPRGYAPEPDLPRTVVACMLRQAARLAKDSA